VIGSDQVAEHRGEPIGKPGTVENARAQLRAMRGQVVLFHTAVCLRGPERPPSERLVTTEVRFRAFNDEELERYLAAEPALDCAGSAKSEGLGDRPPREPRRRRSDRARGVAAHRALRPPA
jgi:septum formation protein